MITWTWWIFHVGYVWLFENCRHVMYLIYNTCSTCRIFARTANFCNHMVRTISIWSNESSIIFSLPTYHTTYILVLHLCLGLGSHFRPGSRPWFPIALFSVPSQGLVAPDDNYGSPDRFYRACALPLKTIGGLSQPIRRPPSLVLFSMWG